MISTFQGWRFQRWRQASLWTAKKIRKQRIRGITRRRLESNARGACRIITQQAVSVRLRAMGNSKTRKLGALWTETEKRWKAIFHLWTADSKTTKKRFFCIRLWLEMRSGYSTTTLRRKNITLSPVNRCHRSQHQHHGRAFIENHVLYLVEPQKDLVYYELLKPGDSITGNRYRLQLICLSRALREKRPKYEQRHDKIILFQRSVSYR